ncbi:MAG: hypothetical protein ACU833_02845 [Gammaproteobacteria bacterium]
MKNNDFPIEQLLAELQSYDGRLDRDVWDPGFEGERRIVITKLGPFVRAFQKPAKFIKRFFHTVYPLSIENWRISETTRLYGGFCTLETELNIRFQSSVKFARDNLDAFPDINSHIKSCFDGLVRDIVDGELINLDDGDWVKTGLAAVERTIETAVNEALIMQKIQCRAVCEIRPTFSEVTENPGLDDKFAHEKVYLHVMQKNFEFREKRKHEQIRQQEALESLEMEQRRKQLDNLDKEDEIQRVRQLKESEIAKNRLIEKEKQREEQYAIEKRLHASQLKHQSFIKEMDYDAELEEQEIKQLRQQQLDEILLENELKHNSRIKEKELEAEILEYEKRQQKWNETEIRLKSEKIKLEEKLREKQLEADILEQEIRATAQQKMEERIKEEKLRHESRLRDMELDSAIHEQQKRFEATKRSDDFLRREIELLVMEKQKAELNKAIKEAERDYQRLMEE